MDSRLRGNDRGDGTQVKKYSPRGEHFFIRSTRILRACDVRRFRAFDVLDDFEGYRITDFEVVERNALHFGRVKEKIFRLSFADNEAKSFFVQRFNSSVFHVNVLLVFLFVRNSTRSLFVT